MWRKLRIIFQVVTLLGGANFAATPAPFSADMTRYVSVGYELLPTQDVNSDGHADFYVVAPRARCVDGEGRAVILVSGRDGSELVRKCGLSGNVHASTALVGDLNGDDVEDLAISGSSVRIVDGVSLEFIKELPSILALSRPFISREGRVNQHSTADLLLVGAVQDEGQWVLALEVVSPSTGEVSISWQLSLQALPKSPAVFVDLGAEKRGCAFVCQRLSDKEYILIVADLTSKTFKVVSLGAKYSYPSVGVAVVQLSSSSSRGPSDAIAVGGLKWTSPPVHGIRLFSAETIGQVQVVTHERAGLSFGSSLALDRSLADRPLLLIAESDAAVQPGGSTGALYAFDIRNSECVEVLRSKYPTQRYIGASVAVLSSADGGAAKWLVGCTLRDTGGASEGYVLVISPATRDIIVRFP